MSALSNDAAPVFLRRASNSNFLPKKLDVLT